MTNGFEIGVAFGEFAGVHNMTSREKKELVEQRDNVTSWLMDGEDHRPIVVPS
jgi:hypothetical protein